MAKITWSVETSLGIVTRDGPTINDANMQRFLDFCWFNYPQYEADGTTLKARTNATTADAVRDWMAAQWNGTKAAVLQYERVEAAQAAARDVSDIES